MLLRVACRGVVRILRVLPGLAVLLFTLLALAPPSWWLNSDMFYPFELYHDVVLGRLPVDGWWVTPSPYFVPDWLLLFPLYAITGDVGRTLTLYGALFWSVAAASLVWLYQRLGLDRVTAWQLAPASVVLLLASVWSAAAGDVRAMLTYPGYHVGALLGTVWVLIAFTYLAGRGGAGALAAVGFGLVGGVCLASDPLLAPQALLPLCIAVLVTHANGRRCAVILRMFIALGLTGLFAYGGWRVLGVMGIQRSEVPLEYASAARVIAGMRAFAAAVVTAMGVVPIWGAALVCTILAAAATLARPKAIAEHERDAPPIRWLAVFVVLALLLTPMAVFATERESVPQVVRYALPVFAYPFLLGPVLLMRLAAGRPAAQTWLARGMLGGALAAAVVCGALVIPPKLGSRAAPYPREIRRFDSFCAKHGLRHGLATYWQARRVTWLSRQGVTMHAILPDLRIEPWLVNVWAYQRDPVTGAPPEFSFVIANGLDRGRLREVFGRPRLQRHFEGLEVWVYDRAADIQLRHFAHGEALALLGRPTSAAKPAFLADFHADGAPWTVDDPGVLPSDGRLRAVFDPPVRGDVLEVAADADDAYEVEVYDSTGAVGRVEVRAYPQRAHMQRRFLRLPESLCDVARLEFRPCAGGGVHCLGHVVVHEDEDGGLRGKPKRGSRIETAGDGEGAPNISAKTATTAVPPSRLRT